MRLLRYLFLPSMLLLPLAGQVTFDFSTPVQLSNTQAAGKWYPDRFAPSAFFSPAVAPDGTSIALQESIAGSDHHSYPDGAFYNTQGRKFDLTGNPVSVTIKLFVPSWWATVNGRVAGFWATTYSPSAQPGNEDYPIIEFQGATTSDQQGPGYHAQTPPQAGFYGWNNVTGNYDFIGLPSGFVYDNFVQLTMTLVPGQKFTYMVSSPLTSVSLDSPLGYADDAYLENVILQGYNYGSSYDIFWGGGSLGGLVPEYFLLYWFFAS